MLPRWPSAMVFEGAIRYAEAIADSKYHKQLVCPPEGTTRLQAVHVFVEYMQTLSTQMKASRCHIPGTDDPLAVHWLKPVQDAFSISTPRL